MQEERQRVSSIIKQVNVVAGRNCKLVNPHMCRTARMVVLMSVREGLEDPSCMVIAECALFHDIGKNDPAARAWLDRFRDKVAPPDEVSWFRRYHSAAGREVLSQANLAGVTAKTVELGQACLLHHEPYSNLHGRMREVLPIIQVADTYDAMTSGEGDHTFNRGAKTPERPGIPTDEAIHHLISRSTIGEYDPSAIHALVYCLGLITR